MKLICKPDMQTQSFKCGPCSCFVPEALGQGTIPHLGSSFGVRWPAFAQNCVLATVGKGEHTETQLEPLYGFEGIGGVYKKCPLTNALPEPLFKYFSKA